jgi:hypothetical protein
MLEWISGDKILIAFDSGKCCVISIAPESIG